MPDPTDPIDYVQLHEFRYLIRRFLRFSEGAARSFGIEPQQHQLLLSIKGSETSGGGIPVFLAADRMQLNHNSTVELIDRAEARGFVSRDRAPDDRRRVIIRLTPEGDDLLRRLSEHHRDELRKLGPDLIAALSAVLELGQGGPAPPPR